MRFWTNGGFFSSVKGHVIKWWQLVIMPVLHINNDKRVVQQPMPQAQQVTVTKPAVAESAMAEQVLMQSGSHPTQSVSQSALIEEPQMKSEMAADAETLSQGNKATEDPMVVLQRINEEKEEKRRQDVEKARKKAQEEARIAAIMNANKVDVNAFIEAGKAAKEEVANKKAEDDALRRAQEIMDRLNREAAEDEAKKEAEIEAAKQEAKKQFG